MKKQVWYEVQKGETIAECLDRMARDGYSVCARKEEPVFHLVNGQPEILHQKIQFKGILTKE